jgi:C-terminal processing protease CtpA/Prc
MSRWTGFVIGVAALAVAGLSVGSGPVRAGDDDEKDKVKEKRVEVVRIGGTGAFLGVHLEDVQADDVARLKLPEERGALVKDVEEDSPAAKAGLKAGDVILRYAGESVASAAALARMVRETPPGRTVALEVSRGGATQKLTATLAERKGMRFSWGDRDFDFVLPTPPIPPEPPLPPAIRDLGRGKGRALLFRDLLGGRGPRRLGIRYDEIEGQLAKYFKLDADRGVLVTDVDEDGPAGKAGMKAGDVILKLDGKAVRDGGDLREALADAEPGTQVTVTVQRDGRPVDLKVTLGGTQTRRERKPTT